MLVTILKIANITNMIHIVLKKSEESSSFFCIAFPETLRSNSTGKVPRAKANIASHPSTKLPVVSV